MGKNTMPDVHLSGTLKKDLYELEIKGKQRLAIDLHDNNTGKTYTIVIHENEKPLLAYLTKYKGMISIIKCDGYLTSKDDFEYVRFINLHCYKSDGSLPTHFRAIPFI